MSTISNCTDEDVGYETGGPKGTGGSELILPITLVSLGIGIIVAVFIPLNPPVLTAIGTALVVAGAASLAYRYRRRNTYLSPAFLAEGSEAGFEPADTEETAATGQNLASPSIDLSNVKLARILPQETCVHDSTSLTDGNVVRFCRSNSTQDVIAEVRIGTPCRVAYKVKRDRTAKTESSAKLPIGLISLHGNKNDGYRVDLVSEA